MLPSLLAIFSFVPATRLPVVATDASMRARPAVMQLPDLGKIAEQTKSDMMEKMVRCMCTPDDMPALVTSDRASICDRTAGIVAKRAHRRRVQRDGNQVEKR